MIVCREQSQETLQNGLLMEPTLALQLSSMAPMAMKADSRYQHWHEPLCCETPVGIHNFRETRIIVLSVLMPVEGLLDSLSVDPTVACGQI